MPVDGVVVDVDQYADQVEILLGNSARGINVNVKLCGSYSKEKIRISEDEIASSRYSYQEICDKFEELRETRKVIKINVVSNKMSIDINYIMTI